jgi:hypothetical protein
MKAILAGALGVAISVALRGVPSALNGGAEVVPPEKQRQTGAILREGVDSGMAADCPRAITRAGSIDLKVDPPPSRDLRVASGNDRAGQSFAFADRRSSGRSAPEAKIQIETVPETPHLTPRRPSERGLRAAARSAAACKR